MSITQAAAASVSELDTDGAFSMVPAVLVVCTGNSGKCSGIFKITSPEESRRVWMKKMRKAVNMTPTNIYGSIVVLCLRHRGTRSEGRKGRIEESRVRTLSYLASRSSPSLLYLPHHQVNFNNDY